MHFDLNNSFYSRGYARTLIDHINSLKEEKCFPNEYDGCYTCFLIQTLYHVGSLESIIKLVDREFYDYLPWWDTEYWHVDYRWLQKRWRSALARVHNIEYVA